MKSFVTPLFSFYLMNSKKDRKKGQAPWCSVSHCSMGCLPLNLKNRFQDLFWWF